LDTLERIISSLLIDIIKAQDCANQYSSGLVPKYRDAEKHGRSANLIFFPVPNSLIKSFEFSLTFALPDQRSDIVSDVFRALDIRLKGVLAHIADRFGSVSGDAWNGAGARFTRDLSDAASRAYFRLLSAKETTPSEKRRIFIDELETLIISRSHAFFVFGRQEQEKLHECMRIHFSDLFDGVSISAANSSDDNLAINYEFDVLKELNDSVLGSIKFQVEMRNYGLGYKERTDGGEASTDNYIIAGE
jgi:hypothetical protein